MINPSGSQRRGEIYNLPNIHLGLRLSISVLCVDDDTVDISEKKKDLNNHEPVKTQERI